MSSPAIAGHLSHYLGIGRFRPKLKVNRPTITAAHLEMIEARNANDPIVYGAIVCQRGGLRFSL